MKKNKVDHKKDCVLCEEREIKKARIDRYLLSVVNGLMSLLFLAGALYVFAYSAYLLFGSGVKTFTEEGAALIMVWSTGVIVIFSMMYYQSFLESK